MKELVEYMLKDYEQMAVELEEELSKNQEPLLIDIGNTDKFGYRVPDTIGTVISNTSVDPWEALDKYVVINDCAYPVYRYNGLSLNNSDGAEYFQANDGKYIDMFDSLPTLNKEEALDKFPESFL